MFQGQCSWMTANKSKCSKQALFFCLHVLAWYWKIVLSVKDGTLLMGFGRGFKYCPVRGEIQWTGQDYLKLTRLFYPSHVRQWGTKVRGSKMIRYHCSPNRKPYWQRIGIRPFLQITPALKGNWKFLSSRGSIVARQKLKRIDGRAPHVGLTG